MPSGNDTVEFTKASCLCFDLRTWPAFYAHHRFCWEWQHDKKASGLFFLIYLFLFLLGGGGGDGMRARATSQGIVFFVLHQATLLNQNWTTQAPVPAPWLCITTLS